MVHSRQKERWILYLLAVLLCLVLTSFWLMCNIYARYTAEGSGSDEARVALFGHDQSIQLSDENGMKNLVPGKSVSYTLKVANYEGAKVSEVSLKYNLEIVTTGNLPLEYTLYKQESNDASSNGKEVGTFIETANEKTARFENDAMYFQQGMQAEDTYTISVLWPNGKNEEKYAGIPDAITVNINVEQVD